MFFQPSARSNSMRRVMPNSPRTIFSYSLSRSWRPRLLLMALVMSSRARSWNSLRSSLSMMRSSVRMSDPQFFRDLRQPFDEGLFPHLLLPLTGRGAEIGATSFQRSDHPALAEHGGALA